MDRVEELRVEEVASEGAGSLTKTNIRFKNKLKKFANFKRLVCATIICQLLSSRQTNQLISPVASSVLDSAKLGGEPEPRAQTILPLHNILSSYIETIHTKEESSLTEKRVSKQEQFIGLPSSSSSSSSLQEGGNNKTSIVTTTETSAKDSLEQFIDKNYLSAGLLDAHVSQSPELMFAQPEAEGQELANSVLAKLQQSPLVNKYKQSEHFRYNTNGDWWTKLASNGKSKATGSKTPQQQSVDSKTSPASNNNNNSKGTDAEPQTTKTGRRRTTGGKKGAGAPATERPSFRSGDNVGYKEQPLSQNQIITLKNQLAVIKSKDKLLVTKSMRQLQQLDGRLVDSYKLCLKKKMPLYAGMLYRTRDFVVRMANDVKHERKVLEAMEKQVQGILKQKMTNKTLVREYEKLVETSTEVTILLQSSSQQSVRQEKATQQQPRAVLPVRTKKDSSSGGIAKYLQEIELATTKKPKLALRYTVSINEVNFKKEITKSQSLIDRIDKSCKELNSVVDDIIYLFKLSDNPSVRGRAYGNRLKYLEGEQMMMSLSEQKRARKLLKSPIRVFLEKYGKLTMANFEPTNSNSTTTLLHQGDINSNRMESMIRGNSAELPDLKPIFEPANLVYNEKPEADVATVATTTTPAPTTLA